jgi:hypothetical protein
MSDTTELNPGQALAEFNEGFSDGWNGRPRKRTTGQYARTYARAAALRKEKEK